MNRRQTIPKHLRYTFSDFNRQFPDDSACLEHLMQQRFPGNVTFCDKCQQEHKHYRINGRPVYSCDHCGTQISPMAGTIFEHSSTSLGQCSSRFVCCCPKSTCNWRGLRWRWIKCNTEELVRATLAVQCAVTNRK